MRVKNDAFIRMTVQDMRKFDASKVRAEFRDGVTKDQPIRGRKYTMTHSDDTGELFVTIGTRFAEDKIKKERDEVLLEIRGGRRNLEFFGTVFVDGPNMKATQFRNEIFLREMPIALKAIRYADRELFERYPVLDRIPIRIWFRSLSKEYNKQYHFGSMRNYKDYI